MSQEINHEIDYLSPANKHASEVLGPEKSIDALIRPEFLEFNKETQSEEVKAVLALTSLTTAIVQDQYIGNGASYESKDFRDHPDLEDHMAVLEKIWGDPEHPRHKTLQVLKLLKERRSKLAEEIKKRLKGGTTFDEIHVDSEAVWRRIQGQDVFILGVNHNPEYIQTHAGFYNKVAQNAGAFVLEGLQTSRLGHSMEMYLAEQKATGYGLLMQNAIQANPDLLFVENDPRDESHVILDEIEANGRLLPDVLINKWFEHLSKWTPEITSKLKTPTWLRTLTRLYSHEYLMTNLARKTQVIKDGIHYGPFPHIDFEDAKVLIVPRSRGLDLGGLSFRDADTSLSLRGFIRYVAENRIKIDGPIIDIQGAQHVDQKIRFLDNPREALVHLIKHPHFRFLPDGGIFHAESSIDPDTNARRIQKQIDAGVFDVDPLSRTTSNGLYTASGFVMAKIINGELKYQNLQN